MQRLPSTGGADRPKIQTAKSFTRFEPEPTSPTTRTRAHTVDLHEPPVLSPTELHSSADPLASTDNNNHDIFETHEEDDTASKLLENTPPESVPRGSSELPIEIQTLTESFLESLGAKVHPTPLSIDRLSQLFQDFYEHAYERIDAHINILATRYPSDQSRTPSVSSAGSTQPRKKVRPTGKSGSKTHSVSADQQMLTPSEIAGRRKARRQLEQQRVNLEEAVERSTCEKVYPRIWRHRSTDDEERDEKLRSRAAALALVGVDLSELLSTALGNDVGLASQLQLDEEGGETTRERLASARESLQRMNDDRFPLGKLNHLKTAHKNIVETLQHIFPSTSSADEVLPTLIFTIITSDPESNHIVSNFNFIQRFRASGKIDGEAAYCLTNLEAAITFLETVDLSSLKSDEAPGGPIKTSSQSSTPRTDTPDPMYHGLPSDLSIPEQARPSKDRATSPSIQRPRRLSFLTQSRQRPFESQSDAVFKKADEAFDTIHNALDGSFKFLFGRLKEQQGSSSPQHGGVASRIPKTLEDASRLISSTTPLEDELSVDGSSIAEQAEDTAPHQTNPDKSDDQSSRMLQMIGGRRSRERSVDSGRSGGSGSRKVSFAEGSSPVASNGSKLPSTAAKTISAKPKSDDNTQPAAPTTTRASPTASSLTSSAPSAFAAVESMRNLGTTLNPLRGLAGMGMMRGFGKGASATTPLAATASLPSPLEEAGGALKDRLQLQDQRIKEGMDLSGVAPPVKRFVDCKEVRELTGYEVELLLRDYQRLAGVLRALREQERNGKP